MSYEKLQIIVSMNEKTWLHQRTLESHEIFPKATKQ